MSTMHRRTLVTAAAGLGAALVLKDAVGEEKPKDKGTPAPSPAQKAVIEAGARCLDTGSVCLARCTDHLAAGMASMADCQRAVMNMLAVVEAMGAAARYGTADPANLKALAKVCAAFCRACEKACEPHAKMHAECKACGEACRDCAKACETFAA